MGMTQAYLYDGLRAVPVNRLEQWLLGLESSTETTEDEAYQGVPWLYRAVHLRADAVAAIPYALWRGETDVSDDLTLAAFRRLLHNLLWLNEATLCLYGATYWLIETNRYGRNLTPRWVVPSTMKPVTDKQQGLTGFERTASGQTSPLTLDQIVYWWVPSLTNEAGPGIPPARVALAAAGVLRNMDRMVEAFFQRGAVKVTLLSVPDGTPQLEIDKLERWWKRLVSGLKRAYEAIGIRASVTPVVIGSDLKDTMADELTQRKREDVAVALGVPPSLLFQEAAYATARHEDRLTFISQTVIPECEMMAGPLNDFLARLGLRYEFQPQQLEVMQTAQLSQATSVAQLVPGKPLLTRDEGRALLGYGPWPEEEAEQPPQLRPPDQPAPDEKTVQEAGVADDEAMRADLRRWREKTRKRGKPCDFESPHIPTSVGAMVRAALDLVGVDAAFRFLRAAPDTRDEAEGRLRDRLAALLARYLRITAEAIEEGQPLDYDAFTLALLTIVELELTAIATEEALRAAVTVGVQFDPAVINTMAAKWAREYSYNLVRDITETTRAAVAQAIEKFISTPGMTRAELVKLLEPTFGPVRAEMIAVTEVTRAYSEATTEYQRLLSEEYGITMVRVWKTRNDELVCPICGPLNEKDEGDWPADQKSGPPAHPRCRCGMGLKYVKRRNQD